jgi:hypothetical protein
MTTNLIKFNLISHISFSVGWLGAVAVFISLAIKGLYSTIEMDLNAVYISMEISAYYVIVPFAIASLITGIIQAVSTKWGLMKHYWIVVKLFLTVFSTLILLLHLQPIRHLSTLAKNGQIAEIHQSGLQLQLIADSIAAMLVLLIILSISIYKPWGKISFSNLKSKNSNMVNIQQKPKKTMLYYINIGFIIFILVFIIMHILGGGMGKHLH